MSRGFTVLIADKNQKDAQQVADALAALALPYPAYVRSGSEAVAWVGSHECDLCVVDYGLPDWSGLETVIRLRQRKPSLPVIITSRAQSEDVAIAAFHAGVVDYVPKKRGYQQVVAELVRKIERQSLQERGSEHLDSAPVPLARRDDQAPATASRLSGPTAGADPLLQPTYQNRLRAIGHELDTHGYRTINLSQVLDGFHVRTFMPGQRAPEVLVFTDRDLHALVEQSVARRGTGERSTAHPRWLPTGYEDFLRAVGYELDQRKAEAITITEFDRAVAIGGVALLAQGGDYGLGPFQEVLTAEDIGYMLDAAFKRRARPQQGGLGGLLRR